MKYSHGGRGRGDLWDVDRFLGEGVERGERGTGEGGTEIGWTTVCGRGHGATTEEGRVA
jgi:hypothetical protein